MNNVERFIASVEVVNNAKVVKFVFKETDVNIENYNQMELEQFILDLKPNSPKSITTICYVLGLYAKWLQEQNIISSFTFYFCLSTQKIIMEKSKASCKKEIYIF